MPPHCSAQTRLTLRLRCVSWAAAAWCRAAHSRGERLRAQPRRLLAHHQARSQSCLTMVEILGARWRTSLSPSVHSLAPPLKRWSEVRRRAPKHSQMRRAHTRQHTRVPPQSCVRSQRPSRRSLHQVVSAVTTCWFSSSMGVRQSRQSSSCAPSLATCGSVSATDSLKRRLLPHLTLIWLRSAGRCSLKETQGGWRCSPVAAACTRHACSSSTQSRRCSPPPPPASPRSLSDSASALSSRVAQSSRLPLRTSTTVSARSYTLMVNAPHSMDVTFTM